MIPFDSLSVEIHNVGGNERKITLSSNSPKYKNLLETLKEGRK